jgi:hypothetical protein
VNQRDYLAEENQAFLKYRQDILNGMRHMRHLESFLKRLKAISKETEIISLDWGDHEEWQYISYKKRIDERKILSKKTGESTIKTECN